jgi:hypothetical protein
MKWGMKHILLGGILIFLFLPLLQTNFHLFKIKDLSGDFVPANNIGITGRNWFNKEFQEKKEKYINDHFGCHHLYIRIHNQLAFSLFKTAKANQVVVGKENYLFEQGYIDAFYGKDYIGVDSIEKKMLMVSYIADTLKRLNKTLLLVFAPGKADFYPEYIPKQPNTPRGITNMEVYLHFAKKLDLSYIDFHTWFREQKKSSKYPLIPKYGIHWSDYGALLAMDSIIKRIEKERNIDMPNPIWKKIHTGKASDQDIDIEKGMNLLFRLKPQTLAYPEIEYENTTGKNKPSTLVVADSYYWQMIYAGISYFFNRSDFWYYFQRAHNPHYKHSKPIEEIDVFKEMDQHEVIIIMASDVNLPKFGWNFIETMFEHYGGSLSDLSWETDHHRKIMRLKVDIESDETWMRSIREKAKIRGISVDSMAFIDAQWIVDGMK